MKLTSKCEKLDQIYFPNYDGLQIYMQPFDILDISIFKNNKYFELIKHMLSKIKVAGTAYLTIDEKLVKNGESHRRGGPHTDGNYIYSWGGGGGWLTGSAGRYLAESQHKEQYCTQTGGMLIASSYSACQGWLGDFDEEPNQGGDCSHIDLSKMDNFILQKNTLYLGNSTFIHESLPVNKNIYRQLIRITLPFDYLY